MTDTTTTTRAPLADLPRLGAAKPDDPNALTLIELVDRACQRVTTRMRTVRLQDFGQDFLEFDLDENNVIVETRPFQGWLWNGRTILEESLRRHRLPILVKPDGTSLELRYPIERISRRRNAPEMAARP